MFRALTVLALVAVLVLAPDAAFAQESKFTFDRVVDILYGLIRTLMAAAAILAGLYIVWTGIQMMLSKGESSAAFMEARKRLTWAVVGFAVSIGAWVIVGTLRSIVSALKR